MTGAPPRDADVGRDAELAAILEGPRWSERHELSWQLRAEITAAVVRRNLSRRVRGLIPLGG